MRGARIALVAAVGAAVAWFTATHAYSLYDDAYIYFRYVDNLFAGCGLRFNCGEAPVEGFTSPVHLMMLAGARLFTTDLESASQILGAVVMTAALSLTVLTALHPRVGASWLVAILLAALLALDHELVLNAVSGLETPLACLAVALVFRLALADRPPVVASLLAILVRPELAVLVAGLVVWRDARRARTMAIVVAALALMTILRVILFHDFVPNTFWAKRGGDTRHIALGIAYAFGVAREFPAIVFAPLAFIFSPLARRGTPTPLPGPDARRATAQILVAAALLFAFIIQAGGDVFEYSRLAAPFVPTLTLLGLIGLARIPRAKIIAPITAALLIVNVALNHSLPAQHGFANVERWKLVGRWLGKEPAGTRIATVPIGAIGYFSQQPLIDLVGLTNREIARGPAVPPEMLTRQWIGHERQNADWVLAQKPELIVFTKWRDRAWTLTDARAGFWAEWQLLSLIKSDRAPYSVEPAEIAPGVHWLVFRRNH